MLAAAVKLKSLSKSATKDAEVLDIGERCFESASRASEFLRARELDCSKFHLQNWNRPESEVSNPIMKTVRTSLSLLTGILVLTFSYAYGVNAQQDEEKLTPLTAEERALDPREVIRNQPDFVADLSIFVGEGFGGYGVTQRLARKGNRYREESEFWIFIGELGKPSARVFPKDKSYDDFEPARGGSADHTLINPAELAKEDRVTFTALGTRVLDGHKCLKIAATRKDNPKQFYFYAALDLKNLVIVAQILEPRRNTVQRLANISLDVPDSLVQIPSDYKPIEHDRWVKLENAKVTYGGKPSNDFLVFRSPGGQLFVQVSDWHYLIRPTEAIVETAFQGLIVTRSGEFIWQTGETEGFSRTSYRTPRPLSKWQTEDDRRVIVTPNSVTFRSNDYKRDKAMISVSW